VLKQGGTHISTGASQKTRVIVRLRATSPFKSLFTKRPDKSTDVYFCKHSYPTCVNFLRLYDELNGRFTL
jgi:hypothetical protein